MTRDVAARLAEGRAAVINTATYVAACSATGYRHPDLTAYGGEVEEWYEAEDGLDLAALDADCATLRAAADTAEEALRVERAGLAAVAAAWGGESGSMASDFVERHLRLAATVMTALRCAARTCADLGEALWRQVDAKVSAAVAIDDRRAGERAAWLAAAGRVLTAAGDRSDAVELVEQQIRPYVDGDIRDEWVAAMRSGTAAVGAAYDHAVAALGTGTPVHFEIPAQLGPAPAWNRDLPAQARPVPVDAPVPVPAGAPATAPPGPPSQVPAPAPAAPPSELPAPTSAVPAAPPPVEAAPAVPSPGALPAAGLPMGGGTLPDGGRPSNLSRWLADAFGGSADPLGGPAETGEGPSGDAPDRPDPAQPPEKPADEVRQDAEDVAAKEDSTDQEKPAEPEQAADVTPEQPAEPPLEPPAEPVAEAPVAVSPPPAEPAAEESTPCEIAAGELPQVGQ